jgi:hypothetical protein
MRRIISRNKGLVALVSALTLSLAAVTIAEGASSGNVVVHFHGSISPRKLPRTKLAPVGVQMGGKIKTKDGTPPPRLTEILLEINKHGVIDGKGLPFCSLGKLRNASAARAKRVCGPAEVGHGNVTSRIHLREQEEFATNGPLLAFNGRYKGKPAIFAHVTSNGRLAITYVIIFQIEKANGAYGTALVAKVPSIASGSGFISAFDLSLKRSYMSGGKKHSYVSAACHLPSEVPIGEFPFARATYVFEDGTKVSEKLEKTCKARG